MSKSKKAGWDRSIPDEIEVRSNWSHVLEESPPTPSLRPPPIEGKDVQLIDNLLSSDEANAIISEAESCGFGKTNYPKHYRGNLRLMANDKGLADAIFERMLPLLPPIVTEDRLEWEVIGLNELWRLSKYVPGDRFSSHIDTCFCRKSCEPREKSMYTVNIYLNDDFEGGTTQFVNRKDDPEATVVPFQGLCLLFRQPPCAGYMHLGDVVTSGYKYLLRSDVMYRVKGPI